MSSPARRRSLALRTGLKTAVLALLWVVFSGKLDALHLGFGALSVGIVLFLTGSPATEASVSPGSALHRVRWRRAAVYPFWLLREVALANLQVLRLILHPRLPIDPVVVRFDSALESPLAKVVFGNSITLTPGTLTLDIDGQRFMVHAITEDSASPTALGAMQRRVAEAFGDAFVDRLDTQVTGSVGDPRPETAA